MNSILTLIFILALRCQEVVLAVRDGDIRTTNSYFPVAYHIGQKSPSNPVGFQSCGSTSSFVLNASSPVLSLDYGAEVAGFPYVEISSLEGEYAQIELKYSEPYEGLGLPYCDGPWYDSHRPGRQSKD
jgi:hypothetical protein